MPDSENIGIAVGIALLSSLELRLDRVLGRLRKFFFKIISNIINLIAKKMFLAENVYIDILEDVRFFRFYEDV